jgi:DNA repair exonuclease SbcCD nuclease subunit
VATYKFLHAADIHLDSPLRGLSRYEGVPADHVRLASRTAFDNLIDAAIEEAVAFVILAGDLFDGDWPDFGTGLYFCAAMGRLERAGIDVYLLHGNHDAESVLTRKLPLPGNVHVFDARKPATFTHGATWAVIHGWSYREKDTRANLAAGYPAAVPNALNIGVLHTALEGRPPHASYAPCSQQDLAARGYDYWALGHVHEFEVVSRAPLMVFPGNLQGRSIREVGPRGAVLVQVVDDRIAGEPERIFLDAIRWSRIDIDVSDLDSEAELITRLRDRLSNAWRREGEGRPLMARVTLTGASPLHGGLGLRREALREDVRAVALAVSEELWIEKVLLRTTALDDGRRGDATLHDELAALLGRGVDDETMTAGLRDELGEFLARTPPDLGGDDDLLAALRGGDLTQLLREAASALDARLTAQA